MQAVKIVGLCILAAVGYGIVLNQVAIRICPEFYWINSPPVVPTNDPTILALAWGVLASWPMGLILGVPLAIAARVGPGPRRDAASLALPALSSLGVVAVSATAAGLVGYLRVRSGAVRLDPFFASIFSPGQHAQFLAVFTADIVSDVGGFVGGLVVIVFVWRGRRRAAGQPPRGSGGGS